MQALAFWERFGQDSSVNLHEVAKRAGVSTATASRVMNRVPGVRESTRRRVLVAAKQLNYAPNVHASALAKGTSRILGVVVSNADNPYFLEVFRSLEEEAASAGYSVMMEHTGYQPARLQSALRSLLGLHLAGVALIVSEVDSSILEELARRELPTVVSDVLHPANNITSIRVNYRLGMRRAVEHLHALGHRRMGFVGHHVGLSPLQERKRTFTDTMERYASGAAFACSESEDTPQGGRIAAAALLDTGFQPTAILCVNDFMAIGVLRELRERGLRVPEDISVTGFDNIVLSEYAVPSLTTLDVPRWRIGRLCFDALVKGDPAKHYKPDTVVEPELVLRGSTGVAAVAA